MKFSFLQKDGVCISNLASCFSHTWQSVSSSESCSYVPEAYQKGRSKILKYCQILCTVTHQGAPCTPIGCWCANIQVAIIIHLRGSSHGKYWSCPSVKAMRVLLLIAAQNRDRRFAGISQDSKENWGLSVKPEEGRGWKSGKYFTASVNGWRNL